LDEQLHELHLLRAPHFTHGWQIGTLHKAKVGVIDSGNRKGGGGGMRLRKGGLRERKGLVMFQTRKEKNRSLPPQAFFFKN